MKKLISKKAVRELVGFSSAHIDRFETDPTYAHVGFPRRLRVGFRVFWVEDEIHAWIEAQIAKRDAPK
jgi:predicted DNA-binding transcriptional regulator AlpA